MADDSNAGLSSYPRPNVAVDIAVLTVVDDALHVVIQQQPDGRPALPGRFIRERRTVDETVREVLELKLGLSPDHVRPHLLAVFSDPDRDPRGWTISIAHAVALPPDELSDVIGELAPLDADGHLASGERLLYDHDDIVTAATDRLRRRYEDQPDPDNLLRTPHTLSELRALHEAILGRRLMRDSFNRRVQPLLRLETDPDGNPETKIAGGRPARLFYKRSGPTASFGWRLPGMEDDG